MDKNKNCTACNIIFDKDNCKKTELFVRIVTIERKENTIIAP